MGGFSYLVDHGRIPGGNAADRRAAIGGGGHARRRRAGGPFDLSAWRFGDGDSKRYIQSAWGRWIPAFAGMTWVSAGMTWVSAGMTWVSAGMTVVGYVQSAVTWAQSIPINQTEPGRDSTALHERARRLAVPHVHFDLLEGSSALPGRVGRHQPNLDGVHAAAQHRMMNVVLDDLAW